MMEKDQDVKAPSVSGAKQTFRPRRERKEAVTADEKPPVNAQEETIQNEDAKPRRRRAADQIEETEKGAENGGWMSMTPSENKNNVKKSLDEGVEIAPQASNRDKHFQENDDEIIIIPDLDEDGNDADQRIAHAPRNVNRKIPTLNELENEIKAAVTSVDSGFDFGVLLNTLVPSIFLAEADTLWTFENLLRDVTDELTVTSKTVTDTSVKPTTVPATAEKSKIPVKSNSSQNKAPEHQNRVGK